jgi:hypothetical protein
MTVGELKEFLKDYKDDDVLIGLQEDFFIQEIDHPKEWPMPVQQWTMEWDGEEFLTNDLEDLTSLYPETNKLRGMLFIGRTIFLDSPPEEKNA